jgi:hypothetical protein
MVIFSLRSFSGGVQISGAGIDHFGQIDYKPKHIAQSTRGL